MKKKEAPKHLSQQAKEEWKKILNEYDLDDGAGYLILQTALEAFDVMKKCQRVIEKEGMQIKDRFNQLKAHLLCTIERDARAQFLQGLKQLNLDLEPLRDNRGRPGK